MGIDPLKGLTFVRDYLEPMNVDYDTNEADGRNTNHLSFFKAFFVLLTWVNCFSLSGKCFLGIIFTTVIFFYFGIKPRRGKCLVLPHASYGPA